MYTHDSHIRAFVCPLACLQTGQEVVSDLNAGQLAALEFTASRKLRGLSSFFYQEEAGRLFVLNPRILCAYLAFTLFLSIMAALSR